LLSDQIGLDDDVGSSMLQISDRDFVALIPKRSFCSATLQLTELE
jgi:hypothetical protein